MSTWRVTAQRDTNGAWALLQPDLGCVSQCTRLSQVADEMREAISLLSGEPEDVIEVKVEAILPDDLRSQLETLDATRDALSEA